MIKMLKNNIIKMRKPSYFKYRVSHIEMSESKWFWGVEGSIILLISFKGMFKSSGHLTFDSYISYKCQRLASTASEREGVKFHWKIGLLMINTTKRGCQVGSGQRNNSISKALTFLHFWGQRGCRGHRGCWGHHGWWGHWGCQIHLGSWIQ